jgi:hypothetical protein
MLCKMKILRPKWAVMMRMSVSTGRSPDPWSLLANGPLMWLKEEHARLCIWLGSVINWKIFKYCLRAHAKGPE